MTPAASTSTRSVLKVSYDEYIRKGAETKRHVTALVGIDQSAIPTRGRNFGPRR